MYTAYLAVCISIRVVCKLSQLGSIYEVGICAIPEDSYNLYWRVHCWGNRNLHSKNHLFKPLVLNFRAFKSFVVYECILYMMLCYFICCIFQSQISIFSLQNVSNSLSGDWEVRTIYIYFGTMWSAFFTIVNHIGTNNLLRYSKWQRQVSSAEGHTIYKYI